MGGLYNNVFYGDNVDFTGNAVPSAQVTTDGQLLIGATAAPHIRAGTLTSTGGTVNITPGAGTINLEATGGGTIVAFLGYLNPAVSNVTGNGTIYTLGTDALTVAFDIGSNFTTAGVFTAPVTGIYDLRVGLTLTNALALNPSATLSLITTSATYGIPWVGVGASFPNINLYFSVLTHMTATNTAYVTVVGNGAGADQWDISGGTAPISTYFCGTLVG